MKKFFKACKKVVVGAAVAVSVAVTGVATCFASMDTTTMTGIKSGIATTTTDFYEIGGAILLVLAGIWAFSKIRGLLGK